MPPMKSLKPTSTDPAASELRETLYDLGSRSELVRNQARERALAAGAECVLLALEEEDRRRKRRKRLWWIAEILFSPGLLMIPGLLRHSFLMTAIPFCIGFIVVPAARVLHEESRRWCQEATTLLVQFEGPEATLGLIAALDNTSGLYYNDVVRPAVIQRLFNVKEADRSWLTIERRSRLMRELRVGDFGWERVDAMRAPFLEAVCHAARMLNAVETISHLETLTSHHVYNAHQRRVRAAAQEALNVLKPIAERQKPGERLLRPAEGDSDFLLQPAMAQEPTAPNALLRPALSDGSIEID